MGREVELVTKRLLLRAFRAGDVDDALAYRDDREFARHLRHIPQPFTRAHAEAFVETNMTEPWETLPTFAIVVDDHVIGTVNFNIDPEKRSAMIGYAISRAHWGRGLATEAATAAIGWLCSEHELLEIWASTDVDNTRSRRVLEKLGLSLERVGETEARYGRAMTTHALFTVEVGYQVFLKEGGEEIGAVRQVTPEHLVVYIEGARDFTIAGTAVLAAHHGKVVLDPSKVEPELLEAARHAHESETE